MAESELVLYEVDGRVAVITLNRPEKANAQTPAMLDQIDACFTPVSYTHLTLPTSDLV